MTKKFVWTCDYCGGEYETKKESDSHENTCKLNPNNRGFKKYFQRTIKIIAIIMLISAVLGISLAIPYLMGNVGAGNRIVGNSMNPTLKDGEVIKFKPYNKYTKLIWGLRQGDIVVFKSSDQKDGVYMDYVKRVVGVQGDNISIKDGYVYVNNELIKEPYTKSSQSTYGTGDGAQCNIQKIPEGKVYVLGDNRKRSKDSRDLGLISVEDIQGILPKILQNKYKSEWRDTSKDTYASGKQSFNIAEYYEKLNKIRTEKGFKPVTQNEKLEKAAIARAKSIVENNEYGKSKSKYPFSEAIQDAGYSNTVTGEIMIKGYFDSDELLNYWTEFETADSIYSKDYQDTGIGAFIGKVNDCDTQVIVQEFGGYKPPNYSKDVVDSWKKSLEDLKSIQPNWLQTKSWGAVYEKNKSDYDRINQIISIRIAGMQSIVNKMNSNQWLSTADNNFIKQDKAFFDEEEALANKLNGR